MTPRRLELLHFGTVIGVIAAKRHFSTVDSAVSTWFLAELAPDKGFMISISPFWRDSWRDSQSVNEGIIAALLGSAWLVQSRSSQGAQGRQTV